jgi:hypothetical protein
LATKAISVIIDFPEDPVANHNVVTVDCNNSERGTGAGIPNNIFVIITQASDMPCSLQKSHSKVFSEEFGVLV